MTLKFNYFYNGTAIHRDQFVSFVPENWENEVKNGEYSWGYYKAIIREESLTYDVHFNDDMDSNNKGFQYSYEDAKGYIDSYNGTNESYFEDYKGGVVSIICNETGETVFEVEII